MLGHLQSGWLGAFSEMPCELLSSCSPSPAPSASRRTVPDVHAQANGFLYQTQVLHCFYITVSRRCLIYLFHIMIFECQQTCEYLSESASGLRSSFGDRGKGCVTEARQSGSARGGCAALSSSAISAHSIKHSETKRKSSDHTSSLVGLLTFSHCFTCAARHALFPPGSSGTLCWNMSRVHDRYLEQNCSKLYPDHSKTWF